MPIKKGLATLLDPAFNTKAVIQGLQKTKLLEDILAFLKPFDGKQPMDNQTVVPLVNPNRNKLYSLAATLYATYLRELHVYVPNQLTETINACREIDKRAVETITTAIKAGTKAGCDTIEKLAQPHGIINRRGIDPINSGIRLKAIRKIAVYAGVAIADVHTILFNILAAMAVAVADDQIIAAGIAAGIAQGISTAAATAIVLSIMKQRSTSNTIQGLHAAIIALNANATTISDAARDSATTAIQGQPRAQDIIIAYQAANATRATILAAAYAAPAVPESPLLAELCINTSRYDKLNTLTQAASNLIDVNIAKYVVESLELALTDRLFQQYKQAFLQHVRTIQLKAYVNILATNLQEMKKILDIQAKATGNAAELVKVQKAVVLLGKTDEASITGMLTIVNKLKQMSRPTPDLITGLSQYMLTHISEDQTNLDIFNKYNPLFYDQLQSIGYAAISNPQINAQLVALVVLAQIFGIPPLNAASNGVMKHRMESDDGLDEPSSGTPGTPGSTSAPGSTDLSTANEQDLALAKLPKGRTIRSYGLEDISVPPIGTPIPDDWKNIDPYRVIATQYNLINASQTKGDAWAKLILNEIINNDCFSDPNIMYSTTCPNLRDYLYEMSMASLTGEFTMEPPEIPTNETYGIVELILRITLDALASALDNNPALKGLTGFSRDLARELLSIENAIDAILNPKPLLLGSTGSTIDVSAITTEIGDITAMINAII